MHFNWVNRLVGFVSIVFVSSNLWSAAPFSTSFSYQGRLNDGTNAANGNYELHLEVFNSETSGHSVGGPVPDVSVTVSNGFFSCPMDFGSEVFKGDSRWLEISVRTNGTGPFVTLSPRQKIAPTPYAITADSANNLSGTLPASQLGGTYSSALTFDNPGNSFSGNGNGLAKVNAATLGGLGPSHLWQVNGNRRTIPGEDFLGTLDDQALELKVNRQRALRLEPNDLSPNLIGGFGGNTVHPAVTGGTIGGGGMPGEENEVAGDFGTVAGGLGNTIDSGGSFAVISGGRSNQIHAPQPNPADEVPGGTISGGEANLVTGSYATISGGNANNAGGLGAAISGGTGNLALSAFSGISGGSGNSVINGQGGSIVGGTGNMVGIGAPEERHYAGYSSVVGGGTTNRIIGYDSGTIGGGEGNLLVGGLDYFSSSGGTIAGGIANYISNSEDATVGGGSGNRIEVDGTGSTISGGVNNTVQYSVFGGARGGTIAGGENNLVSSGARFASIGGGQGNIVRVASRHATIGGGRNNQIDTSADSAVIAGGADNAVAYESQKGAIGGGDNNQVGAEYGTIPGGSGAMTRLFGQMAYATGPFINAGDAQTSVLICRSTTSDALPTELFLDGYSQRMIVPTNSTWGFDITIAARAANGNSGAYQIRGTVKNVGGITSIVGSPAIQRLGNDDPTWDILVSADLPTQALSINVTGASETSIRWVATVRTTEVVY